MIHPTPNLLGKSALEQGVIEMFRRKIEIDGLNSVGEAFRRRIRTFPGLVNCCTIDWFL